MKVWCIKMQDGKLNHASACMKRDDCIKNFIELEAMIVVIANYGRVARGHASVCKPTWEQYEAEGYSCVPCVFLEIKG